MLIFFFLQYINTCNMLIFSIKPMPTVTIETNANTCKANKCDISNFNQY